MSAEVLVIVGPITSATRLLKCTQNKGNLAARIVHTPSSLGGGGCSYSIKTMGKNLPGITEAAQECNIKIKGTFLIDKSSGKEAFYVIS